MQREIASVMASCAMRGIRYIAFPPVVFQTPVAVVEAPHEEAVLHIGPEKLGAPAGPVAAIPELPLARTVPVMAEPLVPQPFPAPALATPVAPTPPPRTPMVIAWPTHQSLAPPQEVPQALPPEPDIEQALPPRAALHRLPEGPGEAGPAPARLRRLTELSAADIDPPAEATAPRRFALLNDIAVELRPRRVRARAGKPEWP